MNRDFKGIWIPKEIWFIPKLKPAYRVFLAEIDSLDRGSGCWAQNGHFSQLFGLSKNRCSEIIHMLEKRAFIEIEHVQDDGDPIRVLRLKNPVEKSTALSRNRQTPSENRQTPSENRQPIYKDEIYIEKYKEREARALDFLKKEYPSRYEQEFLMRHAKNIRDVKKFSQDFNDTVDIEQLDYTDRVLFARLNVYARNWVQNQDKYNAPTIDKPNYLNDADI
jgi:hypothetical protein